MNRPAKPGPRVPRSRPATTLVRIRFSAATLERLRALVEDGLFDELVGQIAAARPTR